MSWPRWAGQQLGGLAAVLVGLLVAMRVLHATWSPVVWVVFGGAWLVLTAVQAVVRLRRPTLPQHH